VGFLPELDLKCFFEFGLFVIPISVSEFVGVFAKWYLVLLFSRYRPPPRRQKLSGCNCETATGSNEFEFVRYFFGVCGSAPDQQPPNGSPFKSNRDVRLPYRCHLLFLFSHTSSPIIQSTTFFVLREDS
jgi:hypothetical protein